MPKHKRTKGKGESRKGLACFSCGRAGSFWVARPRYEDGRTCLVPSCSRCLRPQDEVMYDCNAPLNSLECDPERSPRKEREVIVSGGVGSSPSLIGSSWNVRPSFVTSTSVQLTQLQRCLNNVFGRGNVNARSDQRMYGMWRRFRKDREVSVCLSPFSCVTGIEAIGVWSLDRQRRLKQVDLLANGVEPGSSVMMHWVDEETILVSSDSETFPPHRNRFNSYSGILVHSFGLYVRSKSGTCSFTLDCWNGGYPRSLVFQNPSQPSQWIIGCDAPSQGKAPGSFHHPILEVSGMLPDDYRMVSDIPRFLEPEHEMAV